jgi:hypothetical protein
MNKGLAIIIQGPSSNVDELKAAWHGYDLIWSTWKGDESKYTKNDIALFNHMPLEKGVGNIKLQQLTTVKGIEKAKELGYNRVFKWRSDMVPTNPSQLISLLTENVNILFFHNHLPFHVFLQGNIDPEISLEGIGSYVDYVMESNVDVMASIWDFNEVHGTHAEALITANIQRKNIKNINLFGGGLDDNNDILWLKNNLNIKDYKKHKEYEYHLFNDEL